MILGGNLILHDRHKCFLTTQGEQNVKLTFITLSGDLPASDWTGWVSEYHVSLTDRRGKPLSKNVSPSRERTYSLSFLIQLPHQVHCLSSNL